MTHRQPEQPTQPSMTPANRPVRPWLPFAVVGAAVAVILIAFSFVDSETDGTPAAPAQTLLKVAHDSCSAGILSDGDRTMTLDMAGDDSGSGTLSFDQVACVLVAVDTPSSISSRMDATRALDGMQDAEWDGFHASWTYHPDQGLDIILTEN